MPTSGSSVYHIDPSIYGWLGTQGYWGGQPASGRSPFEDELHKLRQTYSLNGVDQGVNPNNAWFQAEYENLLKKYPQGFSTPVPGAAPSGTSPTGLPGTAPPVGPTAPGGGGGFNLNPAPHAGQGIYGLVPGALGLPDPAGDLGRQIPGLQGLNARASGVINSYLGGELPADVQAAIQDAAAQYGVTSGMPGSGLQRNRTARDLGLTSLDLTGRGLQSYGPFVGAVSGTQTVNPALQTQIAETNALNAAAPDPTAAGSHAEALYREYLNSLSRSGGGGVQPRPYSGGSSFPSTPRYGSGGGGGGIPPIGAIGTPGTVTGPQNFSVGNLFGYGNEFDSFLNENPFMGFDQMGWNQTYQPGWDTGLDAIAPWEGTSNDAFLNFDPFAGSGTNWDMTYDEYLENFGG